MSTALATARYQHAQVATADRGRLLLLMFEGALKFLGRAEAAIADGDLERFGIALGRAEAVIAELLHTLDFKAGGEIARNLDRLYRFMLDHLIEANVAKSTAHVARVARILGVIAGGYREILEPKAQATHAA
jgi:flagellar protein FliS